MKVLSFKVYRDGGTIEIMTTEGSFCYDHRIMTTTRGKLFVGHPDKGIPIEKGLLGDETPENVEQKIIEALKEYKDSFYQSQIDNLILLKS